MSEGILGDGYGGNYTASDNDLYVDGAKAAAKTSIGYMMARNNNMMARNNNTMARNNNGIICWTCKDNLQCFKKGFSNLLD